MKRLSTDTLGPSSERMESYIRFSPIMLWASQTNFKMKKSNVRNLSFHKFAILHIWVTGDIININFKVGPLAVPIQGQINALESWFCDRVTPACVFTMWHNVCQGCKIVYICWRKLSLIPITMFMCHPSL